MRITVTLSDVAIARIDGQAKLEGRSRAGMIRFLLGDIGVRLGAGLGPSSEPVYIEDMESGGKGETLDLVPRPSAMRPQPAQPLVRPFVGPIPKPRDAKRKA